jgi:hypothetical protein
VIPLNQLLPECLLALGAAFLLGNLAAYVRLRPAWREAKAANTRGGKPQAKGRKSDRADASAKTKETAKAATAGGATSRPPGAAGKPAGARGRPAGVKAAARPRSGASGRVNARVREPTASKSLPSRTRVLANVIIGFLVTVAALAALIRG